MSQNVFSMRPFEATRVRVESTRSFDEVLRNLRALVGMAPLQAKTPSRESSDAQETLGEVYQAVTQGSAVITLERLEHLVQSQVGESGFMLFLEIDHRSWMPAYGMGRKVVRWILGNPLIGETMMRHDLTAGLFVPLELLLLDHASGQGSTLIYDLPSSLIVIEPHPELLEAAQELDRKVETLVRRVTGVEQDEAAEERDRSH